MKVRDKKTKHEGTSNKFNMHALSEVIVYWDSEDCSSEFIDNLEVKINNTWIDLDDAFSRKLVITDNYNSEFREPINLEEQHRGYFY